MNIRKYINKLFGRSLPDAEDPTISPTYEPNLAKRIKVIGKAIEEEQPDRDYSRVRALKKAYSTKHPTPAQLKIIHLGSEIVAGLPTNMLIQYDEERSITLEDELQKISDIAALAGTHLETEHRRLRFSTIEHAKLLAGHTLTDSQPPSSYVDKLNNLASSLKKRPNTYPARIRKKIEYAANAICNMAEGHAPDNSGLESLIVLDGCIHAINELVKLLKLHDRPEKDIEKTAIALQEHVNNYENGPMGLMDSVENLFIHAEKYGKVFKDDVKKWESPEVIDKELPKEAAEPS